MEEGTPVTDLIPLRRALLSVYDKTGLIELGRDLADAGERDQDVADRTLDLAALPEAARQSARIERHARSGQRGQNGGTLYAHRDHFHAARLQFALERHGHADRAARGGGQARRLPTASSAAR